MTSPIVSLGTNTSYVWKLIFIFPVRMGTDFTRHPWVAKTDLVTRTKNLELILKVYLT